MPTKPKLASNESEVEFIVIRNSTDETTLAIVEAVVPHELRGEAAFLAALKKGLTTWCETTKEGRDEWEGSSEDFNVGDLSNCPFRRGVLKKMLAEVGIRNLKIKINSREGGMGMSLNDWSYDTILMEPGTTCNLKKRAMSHEEFLAWIFKIAMNFGYIKPLGLS